MDKAARAAQVARCVEHTGDAFTFAPGGGNPAVTWYANPTQAAASAKGPLNPLIPAQALRLVGPRSAFATSREPGEGDYLKDANGKSYRVHAREEDRLNPLLTLYVTASA